MKQILHIFAKDVRRLKIEILLSLITAALFACVVSKSWFTGPTFGRNSYQEVSDWLKPLVFLSWGLLIARLIHGEVLVGDRQFWMTRPFEWPKLLGAKVFFAALLLYLPFLLMQFAILLQAGFNPLSYLATLLYRLLLISLFFIPLIGLAALTSNLAQMVLMLLGALVVLLSWRSLEYLPLVGFSQGNNGPAPYNYVRYGELAAVAVTLLSCGVAIALLYARKRVLVARLLLGSTPVLVLLAYLIGVRSVSMDRVYRPAGAADPSVIRLIPFEQDEASRAAAGRWGATESNGFSNIESKRWAFIKVRLRASAVAAGDLWQLNAFRPTLTPAHGTALDLHWQQGHEVFEAAEAESQLTYVTLVFLIPRSEYERLKSLPLTLHLDFALTQARPARSWQLALPEGSFTVPDLASCSSQHTRYGGSLQVTGVACRFPLRMPVLSLKASYRKGPCPAAPTAAGNFAPVTVATLGDFNTAPATFGISPMEDGMYVSFPDNHSFDSRSPVESQTDRVCPGTPVIFTQYRKVRAVQTGVTIDKFRPED